MLVDLSFPRHVHRANEDGQPRRERRQAERQRGGRDRRHQEEKNAVHGC
jgi:hypothetical protein